MVSRIEPLTPLKPEAQRAMDRLLPPGMRPPALFAGVARNAGLFAYMVDTGIIGPTGLLDRRVLPKALRECAVLRTCFATRNDYEFNLHVQTISDRMGLGPAQIDDVRRPRPDPVLWSEDQLAAIRLVDAAVGLEVEDALWEEIRAVLGIAAMVEITQLAGLYVGVAMQCALLRPTFDLYRFPAPVRARID